MEKNGLKAAVEALIFVSGEPITMKRFLEVLEGVDPADLEAAARELVESYRGGERGVEIVEVAGGFQMVTRPECAGIIKRLEKIKLAAKLSRSALEALAVIAYKQPVTRGEIEAIRGVDSSNVLRTLLERRVIRIVGRREGLGRPMLYGTTREFLEYFGLKDLSELPALKDFKEVAESLPEPDLVREQAQEPVADSIQ